MNDTTLWVCMIQILPSLRTRHLTYTQIHALLYTESSHSTIIMQLFFECLFLFTQGKHCKYKIKGKHKAALQLLRHIIYCYYLEALSFSVTHILSILSPSHKSVTSLELGAHCHKQKFTGGEYECQTTGSPTTVTGTMYFDILKMFLIPHINNYDLQQYLSKTGYLAMCLATVYTLYSLASAA